MNYLFRNIESRREIDFAFYFDGDPTHYYEVKTEKDGVGGFKKGLHSLFDLYTQDSGGIFHLILSAGMSSKVGTMIVSIKEIQGKSRINDAHKRTEICNFLSIDEREFRSYKGLFDKLDFKNEGNFDVDSPELIKDGSSLDAIIKNMLEIPYSGGKFRDWPSIGSTKDEVISSLLREISKVCSEKLPSKRKIERKAFLEKLTEPLARNLALVKEGGSLVGQDKIRGFQQGLLNHYFARERILAEKVDSMKEPSKA